MTAAGSPMRTRRKRSSYPFLDPEVLAKEVAVTALHCNLWSDLEKLDMSFSTTARELLIRENRPGAWLAAEKTDQGPVGNLLRMIRSEGYHSKRPEVHAAIEARVQVNRNRKIKAHLDRKRNTGPVLDAQAAVQHMLDERMAVRDLVTTGDAIIDQDVRNTPDCRDVRVGWPVKWVNGLPKPVQNGSYHRPSGTTGDTPLETSGTKQTAAERSNAVPLKK